MIIETDLIKTLIEANSGGNLEVIRITKALTIQREENKLTIYCRAVTLNDLDEWAMHNFYEIIIDTNNNETLSFEQEQQHEFDSFDDFIAQDGLHVIKM